MCINWQHKYPPPALPLLRYEITERLKRTSSFYLQISKKCMPEISVEPKQEVLITEFNLGCVATELLTEGDWSCILSVSSTNFDDVLKFSGFRLQRKEKPLETWNQNLEQTERRSLRDLHIFQEI